MAKGQCVARQRTFKRKRSRPWKLGRCQLLRWRDQPGQWACSVRILGGCPRVGTFSEWYTSEQRTPCWRHGCRMGSSDHMDTCTCWNTCSDYGGQSCWLQWGEWILKDCEFKETQEKENLQEESVNSEAEGNWESLRPICWAQKCCLHVCWLTKALCS